MGVSVLQYDVKWLILRTCFASSNFVLPKINNISSRAINDHKGAPFILRCTVPCMAVAQHLTNVMRQSRCAATISVTKGPTRSGCSLMTEFYRLNEARSE